jgi:hypothetical protein
LALATKTARLSEKIAKLKEETISAMTIATLTIEKPLKELSIPR